MGVSSDWLEMQLPTQIKSWLQHQPSKNSYPNVKGFDKPLRIRYLGQPSPGEFLLRFVEDDEAVVRAVLREHYHVTDRETEVLYWIAQGKANREIGEILATSPRTINKHLEQIYRKLDVDNRTSAATVFLQHLNSG